MNFRTKNKHWEHKLYLSFLATKFKFGHQKLATYTYPEILGQGECDWQWQNALAYYGTELRG